jgi:putative DNA primase/helicase
MCSMRDTPEIMPDAGDDAIEIAALACLTPMEYGRRRVAEAKRLGVPVGTLDGEVTKAREALMGKEDRQDIFRAPDPWGEPVSTAEALDATVAAVRRHVILPAAAADCVALWIAHSWVFEQFHHTPRLAVTSPTMRCGKSTLLDLLHALCRRALKADNITAAALFRVVEMHGPTLAVDEADSFLAGREELRGILNSGYERHGAAIRVEKTADGEQVPKTFSTFAPLAIAAIGRIPGTVADRAVPITLKRKLPGESVQKMRLPASRAALVDLARMLARWASDHVAALSLEPDVPDQLNDRQGDISVPLLSIADLAGEAWGARARSSLTTTFGVDSGEPEESVEMLLGDIRAAFEAEGAGGRISTDTLLDYLFRLDDRPWGEVDRGRPITARQLSARLAPLGVQSRDLRFGREVRKGYRLADFADAFARYLPAASNQGGGIRYAATSEENPTTPCSVSGSATDIDAAASATDPHRETARGVADVADVAATQDVAATLSATRKPAEYLGCSGVADSAPQMGAGERVLRALGEATEARVEMTAALAGAGVGRVLPGGGPARGCAEPGASLPRES